MFTCARAILLKFSSILEILVASYSIIIYFIDSNLKMIICTINSVDYNNYNCHLCYNFHLSCHLWPRMANVARLLMLERISATISEKNALTPWRSHNPFTIHFGMMHHSIARNDKSASAVSRVCFSMRADARDVKIFR